MVVVSVGCNFYGTLPLLRVLMLVLVLVDVVVCGGVW